MSRLPDYPLNDIRRLLEQEIAVREGEERSWLTLPRSSQPYESPTTPHPRNNPYVARR